MKTIRTVNGFTREELLSLAWEKPMMAQIAVTENCNQKCIFCFQACSPDRKFSSLSLNQWKIIIRKLKNIGVRILNFSGGEVFIYPYLLDLIKWAKLEMNFSIHINTNGTFDVSDFIEYVDGFIFSVHGLNKVHDEIVGKRNAFSLLEKNISIISEKKVNILINMVLLKSNYHQILDVFRYFDAKYRISKFAPFIPIQSLFAKEYDTIAVKMDKNLIKDYIDKLKKIPEDKLDLKHGFQSIFINKLDFYKSAKIPLPNCAAGKYKIIIDYNGDVYPCNFFKGDEYYCGNILEEDEYEIWKNGKGFIPFRKLILENRIPKECSMCLKKERCFSGCRAWSDKYQKGGFYESKDIRCSIGNAYIGN